MNNIIINEESIENFNEIINAIKTKDFIRAEKSIKKQLVTHINSPIPHNLYAILCELNKDFKHARCHYRAALDLDPSYTPAMRNLDRVTRFFYSNTGIDYGDSFQSFK
jgi:Flp pilus assembly protein TadD